jgi:hypothetical protein
MGRVMAAFLLLASSAVLAQIEPGLTAPLRAMGEATGSKETAAADLTGKMMAIAKDEKLQPKIDRLSHSLADALWGRHFAVKQAAALSDNLMQILQRVGPSNFEVVSRAWSTLAGMGLDEARVRVLARDMLAIREQLRGPDDTPVRPPLLRPLPPRRY